MNQSSFAMTRNAEKAHAKWSWSGRTEKEGRGGVGGSSSSGDSYSNSACNDLWGETGMLCGSLGLLSLRSRE